MSKLSRRNLLGAGAGLAAAGLAGLPASAVATSLQRNRPRNIIFMVSDGMSQGVPAMADQYLQMATGKSSCWHELMQDDTVVHGLQDTRSLSSLVTDSAAASSSWGSGRHVWNGQINVYPDGTVLRPLYDLLKGEAKMRTGLVTTATITHATPAGFAVSIDDRDREWEIAEKYLKAGVDVLMGGGDRFFSPQSRTDKRNLYAEYARAGYQIVRDKDGVAAAGKGKPLLGVFSTGQVPYRIDRDNDPELAQVPGLKQMALKAIELLDGTREGFVLQVEAARVDHAAHANDFGAILWDQIEFDETVRAVVEWARRDRNTLVVITSDHGNSNPGLVGAGPEYFDSNAGLKTLTGMKSSYEGMSRLLGTRPTADKIREVIEAKLGLKITAEDAAKIALGYTNHPLKGITLYDTPTSWMSICLSPYTHIGWSGRQHTSDATLVSALGAGAEMWNGLQMNVDFFGKLLSTKNVRWQNPKMSFEDAMRMREKKAWAEPTPHWL